jgi:hypothetical protein
MKDIKADFSDKRSSREKAMIDPYHKIEEKRNKEKHLHYSSFMLINQYKY